MKTTHIFFSFYQVGAHPLIFLTRWAGLKRMGIGDNSHLSYLLSPVSVPPPACPHSCGLPSQLLAWRTGQGGNKERSEILENGQGDVRTGDDKRRSKARRTGQGDNKDKSELFENKARSSEGRRTGQGEVRTQVRTLDLHWAMKLNQGQSQIKWFNQVVDWHLINCFEGWVE